MKWDRQRADQRVARAILSTVEGANEVRSSDNLVISLGYDSQRIASLAIALEQEFERPVSLNDWIARCDDPTTLTVGSLCEFVWELCESDS